MLYHVCCKSMSQTMVLIFCMTMQRFQGCWLCIERVATIWYRQATTYSRINLADTPSERTLSARQSYTLHNVIQFNLTCNWGIYRRDLIWMLNFGKIIASYIWWYYITCFLDIIEPLVTQCNSAGNDYSAYSVSKIGVNRLAELQAKAFSTDPSKPRGVLVNAVSTNNTM